MKIKLKDPGSAITHFIGMLTALFAAIPLLVVAAKNLNAAHTISIVVFIVSLLLLYAASTVYHSLDISERVNIWLRKLDHMMIFVLIAGSYTPVCLIALNDRTGYILLGTIWGIAAAGMLLKALWIDCPDWLSSLIYLGMGWACAPTVKQMVASLSGMAFAWLLAGGIIYTIGGIIYALDWSSFDSRHKYFGTHEIFHLFVMGGSTCHFVLMFFLAGISAH